MALKISGSYKVSKSADVLMQKVILVITHFFGREVDALGVTATLDVKDTSVTPDVLIVTN